MLCINHRYLFENIITSYILILLYYIMIIYCYKYIQLGTKMLSFCIIIVTVLSYNLGGGKTRKHGPLVLSPFNKMYNIAKLFCAG